MRRANDEPRRAARGSDNENSCKASEFVLILKV